MKIFVGNIPFELGEKELQEIFERYGEVISASIRRDYDAGYSRGTGFVEMTNDEEGQKAVANLTGYKVKNCRLRVNEARPRAEFASKFDERASMILLADVVQAEPWEKGESGEAILLMSQAILDGKSAATTALLDILADTTVKIPLRAAAGVSLARLGDPRMHIMSVEQMELCSVPEGPFWFGEAGEEILDESLNYNYWLGRYPITNAQFDTFVSDGGYKIDEYWLEAEQDEIWKKGMITSLGERQEPVDFGEPYSLPNTPVVGVTWYEVLAFARWLTKRWRERNILPEGYIVKIPSEKEWEKVARGGTQIPTSPMIAKPQNLMDSTQPLQFIPNPFPKRQYPWGNEYSPTKSNVAGCGINTSNTVGIFPEDASPYGCHEMCGNVLEWTRSLFEIYSPKDEASGNLVNLPAHVFRGASSTDEEVWVRCTARSRDLRTYRSRHRGFRIAICPETAE